MAYYKATINKKKWFGYKKITEAYVKADNLTAASSIITQQYGIRATSGSGSGSEEYSALLPLQSLTCDYWLLGGEEPSGKLIIIEIEIFESIELEIIESC